MFWEGWICFNMDGVGVGFFKTLKGEGELKKIMPSLANTF